MHAPLIGIVTVTYNSAIFLDDFQKSCCEQDFDNFKIYCVDNNSKDETPNILRNNQNSRWSITLNSINVGVAEGNNQGILKALEDGCEWILLLNNDTTFPPNFFRELLSSTEKMALDVVVPKIYLDAPKDHIWYGGGGFSHYKGNTGYHIGLGEEDVGQFNEPKIVSYAPTCAMLVNSRVFTKVGLMDESYFVYFDDTDFCWRLSQSKILIGYWPQTYLVHKVGGSTGGLRSPFTVRMTSRNRLYYLKKHFGVMTALLWMPVFLIYYVIQFVKNKDIACFKASIFGSFEYFQMRPQEPVLSQKLKRKLV